jgi:hypothetical protein
MWPPESPATIAEYTKQADGRYQSFEIAERIPLEDIARAHELVEHPVRRGRVVVML